MKKTILNYIVPFFAVLLMVSCGDDESLTDQLVGTWDIQSINYACTDANGEVETVSIGGADGPCLTEDGSEVCFVASVIISAGGTYTNSNDITVDGVSTGASSGNGTWTLDGSNLSICDIEDGVESCTVGSVSVNGDTMTQTVDSIDGESCPGTAVYKRR